MHQDVHLAPMRTNAVEYSLQLTWHRNVKRAGDWRLEFLRQGFHIRAGPLIQPGDCNLCTNRAECLGAPISNRLVVGHADDKCLLSGKNWSDVAVAHGNLPSADGRRGGVTTCRGDHDCNSTGGEAGQHKISGARQGDWEGG